MALAMPVRDDRAVWDARAEHDVGHLILRYLREHPPPPDTECGGDFTRWAENLVADGLDRLAALGARPLRGIASDA